MANTFPAIAALIGTIIGAGILGIPYVITQSGFPIGLLHILFIGTIVGITVLYLGEIALRTKKNHHLVGYAQKYIGILGGKLMLAAIFFGIYASTLAYTIGVGESLSFLFFESSQFTLYFGIAFWLFMSFLAFFGLKALKEGETIGIIIIFILIISISVLFYNQINIENLQYTNLQNIFVPFGVILFAFMGFTAIPEIERILGPHRKKMKSTIITSYITTLIIYIIFAVIVVGSQGKNTPQLATLSLGKPFILLGILTMATSYLALSMALIDTLKFDLKKSKTKSWLYTISVPILLFIILQFTDSANFIKVLGVGGALSGGLAAILILYMVKNAKLKGDRKPEYSLPYSKILTWILIAIFALGAIIEVYNIF